MDIKILNEENLNYSGINKSLVQEKNLIDNNKYLQIQGLYRKTLDYYILNTSSIKKYDDEILNSGLDFGFIDDKMKSEYHNTSYLGLNYIYVRNFLFIEKLSIEYLNYFYSKIVNNDLEIDNTLIEIVKNTFRDVINDNYKHNEYYDKTDTCYGSVIPSNMVPSNSLVFCIHYGKNTGEYDEKSFMDNYRKKKVFLSKTRMNMIDNLSKELGVEVRVLIRNYVGE